MSDPQQIDLEYVRLNEENQVLRQALLEAQEKCDKMKQDLAQWHEEFGADLDAAAKEFDERGKQLAQAQAACAPMRRWISAIKHATENNQPIPWMGMIERAEAALGEDAGKGWMSPDEAKALRDKAKILDAAVKALQGRLGNDEPEHVVTACIEYVAAEDELSDDFKSEDYHLSHAVASLMQRHDEAKRLEAEAAAMRGALECITPEGRQVPFNKWIELRDKALATTSGRDLLATLDDLEKELSEAVALLRTLQPQVKNWLAGSGEYEQINAFLARHREPI